MKKKGTLITSAILIVIIAIVIVYLKSCAYLPINGTVIDAESGQPIEGAVILAEWTLTHWFPGGPTKSYKVVEISTDKNGRFKVNAYILRPVSDFYLTIYKAGYVCWNNKYIFPNNENRINFKWKNNQIYLLERFKSEYSFNEHINFIEDNIHPFLSKEKKIVFINAYQWEIMMRRKELGDRK